jgi:hypothetical protein
MRRWIELLASLKLNVALLVFMLLVLAGGTIVEALYGTQVARSIYFAPWFLGALALLGINLLCSLWERWPWGRFRIGFVLTHGSMVVILLGARRATSLPMPAPPGKSIVTPSPSRSGSMPSRSTITPEVVGRRCFAAGSRSTTPRSANPNRPSSR